MSNTYNQWLCLERKNGEEGRSTRLKLGHPKWVLLLNERILIALFLSRMAYEQFLIMEKS